MADPAVLGFNPIWAAFDLVGRPAGGAQLFSFHNLNPTVPFPIYMDASASEAWPNPILFDENGQQGPFYFLFNPSFPQDTYFLRLLDAAGNKIWEVSNYFPSGGGGSVITTSTTVKNYLGNSVFWRFGGIPILPDGTSSIFTNPTDKTVICPGNHAAIYTPDIYYTRPDGSLTDAITMTPFAPPGSTPLNLDNTPEYYLNYKCTAVPSGSSVKGIAFPVVSHLKTLENQQMTFSIWGQGISGSQVLSIQYYQYTGTGSNTPTVTVPFTFATINLAPFTGTWHREKLPFIVPSSAGLTLGNNNNSALYIIVGLPLSATCEINFTNVRLYLGDGAPDADFDTYDQIDSVINTPRTGDTRTSMNSFAPFGWVSMNDGTIGSPKSGATTRANFDTFYLYKLIWDQTNTNPTTKTYAPIQDSAGNPVARGGTADADFAANKRLQLLFALGRVFAGADISTNLIGKPVGADSYKLITTDVGPHTHTLGAGAYVYRGFSTPGAIPSPLTSGINNDGVFPTTDPNITVGAQTAISLQQKTLYMNVFIKL